MNVDRKALSVSSWTTDMMFRLFPEGVSGAMTDWRTVSSGERASAAPAPSCEPDTWRVASRCGVEAAWLVESKAWHASRVSIHELLLTIAASERLDRRDRGMHVASSNNFSGLGSSKRGREGGVEGGVGGAVDPVAEACLLVEGDVTVASGGEARSGWRCRSGGRRRWWWWVGVLSRLPSAAAAGCTGRLVGESGVDAV